LARWCAPASDSGSGATRAAKAASSPARISGAPRSAASRAITSIASSGMEPATTGTPGLMMPAFSKAIAASVSPSCAW
jgi:hypothetical protein